MKALTALAAMAFLTSIAFADWGDPIKWNQMDALDDFGAASWLDYDTPSDALTADDFLCTEFGWITDIHFAGWSTFGNEYIDKFRITFWSNIPETPNEASMPGQLLWDVVVDKWTDPNDPYKQGWQELSDGTFSINLPRNMWFLQEGSPTNPVVYWIGIQGVMVTDGFSDSFYWNFRDHNLPANIDDAALMSEYFQYPAWWHWGWDWPNNGPDLYDTVLPQDWTSIDMAFALSGRPVPEPVGLVVFGVGALFFFKSRRR